jgi:hypothetical protein
MQDRTLKERFSVANKGVVRCHIEGCARIGKKGMAKLVKVYHSKVGREVVGGVAKQGAAPLSRDAVLLSSVWH